ncbi:integrase, catalytic region, zinc finger, CCHC-type containing protein [Tanacetum coccineum]
MTLDIHNWSSSAHQEIHKIIKDEIFPIVNQVDARVQNFEIQFLKEAAKFVRDFKSLAKEADKRLLRAVVSQDIMSIVQNPSVVDSSNLQTELERTKERFENCIIKKENEYAKLWNDWYKKCEECKYDKISYDKAYNDMQQKIERLQAQLGDQKGKSKDTPCVSNTLDPLSQKLKNENTTLLRPEGHCQRSNTKNDRVPSASKSSCNKNKEVEVEEHHRNLLLSKNKKHMSSECKHVKLDTRNDQSEVICAMCKQCLITANHDVCMLNYVNDMNSRGKKQKANVFQTLKIKRNKSQRWSPTGKILLTLKENNLHGESEVNLTALIGIMLVLLTLRNLQSNGFQIPLLFLAGYPNLFMFLGTVRFGNDHVAAILGFGDLQWGNILITRVYFVEGLGHNLFSVGQFLVLRFRAIATACYTQNRSIIHRRFNKTPYELINGRKPDISFLHVFGALCYPKNDCKDIGKLGAKGDIGLFLGYYANSCAYRDSILLNAPSTITTQQPTEGELDLLFEAMYDDYVGGHHSLCSSQDTAPTLNKFILSTTN